MRNPAILGIFVLATIIVGCGGGNTATSGSKQPIDIPVIAPVTGPAAFLGKEEQQAFQVLEGTVSQQGGIGGRPVHFVVQDDQSNPSVDVQLANQIIAQKSPVFIGPSLVAGCNAVAPLVKSGPVMYCMSPGIHPDAGSFAFTGSVSTQDLIRALIAYLRGTGITRLAVLSSTDATGQDALSGIKAVLSDPVNASVKIVADERFNLTDVSVAAQVTHVKGSGAQALIAWSTGAAIATVFKAVAQVGLDIPVATTDGNMTYAQMAQYKDFLPAQLLIPAPEWVASDSITDSKVKSAIKTFNDGFKSAGSPPDIGQALAWDPGLIVVAALRSQGADAPAEKIRNYLAHLKGFAGINGQYDFTAAAQRGLSDRQAVVTRWDAAKGTWVPVSGPGGGPK
jgi:branched-chain amino acid transport system substrate-binding protein